MIVDKLPLSYYEVQVMRQYTCKPLFPLPWAYLRITWELAAYLPLLLAHLQIE